MASLSCALSRCCSLPSLISNEYRCESSATQCTQPPCGETRHWTKSPPVRLPEEKVCTSMPERVMMKREDDLLHTIRCSGLSGMKATVLTASSLSPTSEGGRNCEMHSELRTSHTRTVPSLDAETTREPSGEKWASLTKEAWPRISLMTLPDLRPCTRTTWSKEPETTCEPSREKRAHVTPCACALGKRRTHCP